MGKGEEGIGSLFSRTTLAHAVSGSVGSIVAMCLTYPLDRVRTMKQLSKDNDKSGVFEVLKAIIKQEGWFGLYKGLQPMLVALGASNFVYFYFYTALKAGLQYLSRYQKKQMRLPGPIVNLLLASVAGTINVLITTPLWVAFTRVAYQNRQEAGSTKKYKGITDALYSIGKEEGVSSLWSGVGPSLILVSNPSVQFASYEWLKRLLFRFKTNQETIEKDFPHMGDILEDKTEKVVSEAVVGTQMNSIEYLVLGATAKMIATVVTYPLQVAQTRLRVEAKQQEKEQDSENKNIKLNKTTTTMECLNKIYKKDGLEGLYRGMEAKLLQTCLTSAFMFTAYEKICAIILRFFLWQKFKKKHIM